MLGKYAETLVVDWGLAKTLGDEHEESGSNGSVIRVHSGSDSEPTRTGSRVGTPAYMSPEQAAGAIDKIGTASDVYGLGATLYCILTGRPPFDSRADSKKVEQGEFQKPRELNRDVPPGLEAICLKAMAFRPGDRYRTPLELANDVEQWLADEPVSAWPEPVTVRLRRWISRHRTFVSTTAAAFVVAAVGLTAFLYKQAESANLATKVAEKDAELAQSALEKQNELATSVKEVDELLREGASRFGSGNLVDAKGYFDQAFGKADRLGLKDQIAHIQEQLGNINSLVAEQQAKAKDTERLAKLEELWRDAIFYSPSGPYELLAREQDSMKGLKRSRETAKEALALYYLTPESQKPYRGRPEEDSGLLLRTAANPGGGDGPYRTPRGKRS
jgi:serine/threonine protein kinase